MILRKDILYLPLKVGVPKVGDIVHPYGRGFRGPLLKPRTRPWPTKIKQVVYTEGGMINDDENRTGD